MECLIGDYLNARIDFQQSKKFYLHLGQTIKCGDVDYSQGNVFLNMGSFEQAEECYSRALSYYKDNNDTNSIANSYRELGKVCQYREKIDDAMRYYQEAIQLYNLLNDDKGKNVIIEYMADVYRSIGEYDKALEAVNVLLTQSNDNTEQRVACRIYKLAGNVYGEKGFNEKAQQYLEKAYRLSLMTGEISLAMYILCDLGLVYYSLNDYSSAYDYFEQCQEFAEKLNSDYMKTVNLVNLSDTTFKMGDIERSKVYITRAANINHNIGGLNSEIKRIQEEIAQKEGGQEKTS
ncbi:MAG: tetratricopeptide repeat protein [Candidatus Edwardsbacteria bacterium]|nr:tetratricopeptide repeat protein [Candidatus Edwardsbacteria bacterium]